jgi:hypothetical protein
LGHRLRKNFVTALRTYILGRPGRTDLARAN